MNWKKYLISFESCLFPGITIVAFLIIILIITGNNGCAPITKVACDDYKNELSDLNTELALTKYKLTIALDENKKLKDDTEKNNISLPPKENEVNKKFEGKHYF